MEFWKSRVIQKSHQVTRLRLVWDFQNPILTVFSQWCKMLASRIQGSQLRGNDKKTGRREGMEPIQRFYRCYLLSNTLFKAEQNGSMLQVFIYKKNDL